MRKPRKKSYLIIVVIIIAFINIANVKAMGEDKSNILFISSFNYNFITFDDQVRGITKGLNNKANLKVEYMDILNSETSEEKIYNLLKANIDTYGKFDGIIAGDDDALKFCLKYRKEIFGNIPISFIGIQDENLIMEAFRNKSVAGVREMESIDDILKFIQSYQSNVKKITLINDCGENFYDEVKEKYKEFEYEDIVTKDLSIDELRDKLSQFNERDAIISLYPLNYKENEKIGYQSINNIISESAPNTAVYTILNYAIGSGSIGGKVINHFNQGEKGAEIILQLIEGKDPKEISVLDDSANEYIFDYDVLKKFKINGRSFPNNWTLLNSPFEIISKYKHGFIVISVIVLGMLISTISLVLYVTHKRKHEKEMLKAIKEIKEANKLKTDFIYNISHELKTPINVILSAIQLIDFTKDKNQINIEGKFDIIKQNSYRLKRLLNNIIDFEKTESKEMRLELKNVDIVPIIEDLVLSILPYAEHKNLKIIFDTNREEVIMAVDVNKIERAILNLLSNAIKFSKMYGEINIYLEFKENWLSIIIQDNGIGIDKENLEKIFNCFIQVDNSFTRQNEGSGIGLSIAKGFIELHNGVILVESEKNRGTKFIVKLPIVVLNEDIETNKFLEENDIEDIANVELSDIYK